MEATICGLVVCQGLAVCYLLDIQNNLSFGTSPDVNVSGTILFPPKLGEVGRHCFRLERRALVFRTGFSFRRGQACTSPILRDLIF